MFYQKILLGVLAVIGGILSTDGESLSFSGLSDLAGPFDGADRKGHALYVLKLGDVGKIPVYAYWSSAGNVSSPLLGAGWDIPLLSSRIYPISTKCLKLHLPDGYVRHFHKGRDGVYRGGRIWTASVDGDTTRAVADAEDGYPRTVLVFFRGRLTRLECEEGVFDIKNDARAGWSVSSKGAKLFSAVRDTADENRILMRVGNVRLTMVTALADVMLPPPEPGSSPLASRQRCLTGVSFSTGEQHAFAYGADATSAWLDVDGQRLVWDLETQRAKSWKGATFAFGKMPKDGVSGPKVTRTGSSGASESYDYDVRKGLITEVGSNDVTVVTRLFTSGDNAGKVRWYERYERGECVERIDYIYDARGCVKERLVRRSRAK